MDHLSGPELVERAIENHASFKKAAELLEARPPDEAATAVLIRAYREGRSPPWLTAVLLGRTRHPSGYPVVLEILTGAHGSLSESYAGVALTRIAGQGARADLLRVLMTAQHRHVSEGAAYGLADLAPDESLIDLLLEAFQKKRVRPQTFEWIVARLKPPDRLLTAWLAGGEPLRTSALRVVVHLERPSDTVLTHVGSALKAGAGPMSPWVRRRLERLVATET